MARLKKEHEFKAEPGLTGSSKGKQGNLGPRGDSRSDSLSLSFSFSQWTSSRNMTRSQQTPQLFFPMMKTSPMNTKFRLYQHRRLSPTALAATKSTCSQSRTRTSPVAARCARGTIIRGPNEDIEPYDVSNHRFVIRGNATRRNKSTSSSMNGR